MLDQIRFSFRLKVLSYLHVGSGKRVPLSDLRGLSADSDEGKAKVAGVQRDWRGWPVVEGSSIRGALRAFCRRCSMDEEDLFGPDEISSGRAGNGCLWLRTGFLFNADTLNGLPCDLPSWSVDLPNGDDDRQTYPYTFVLPGIRLDADSGTVDDGLLYHVEFVPKGAEFLFSGVYFGSKDQFIDQLGPLFNEMARGEGFALGAVARNGNGRVQLIHDSVKYESLHYSVLHDEHLVRSGKQILTAVPANGGAGGWSRQFVLTCEGPFFIMDPVRAASMRKLLSEGEHGPDMVALQDEDGAPILTGKAILQDLRRRSAWLERCNALKGADYNYDDSSLPKDDRDRHLRDSEKPEDLEITQRLFGVAGWAKTVSIDMVPIGAELRQHHTQGIKLDVFSQTPIDGALIDVDVPANVRYSRRLRLDESRYRSRKELEVRLREDRAHLECLIESLLHAGAGVSYGHSTGVGYGAFVVEEAAEASS